jgi:hypothetical protein
VTDEAQQTEQKAERTYSEAEVERKLRGQAKELAAAKARVEDLEAAAGKTAAEFEALETARTAAATEAERERTARSEYEAVIEAEVKSELDAVEEKVRDRWSKLLDGKPVLERRVLLRELVAAARSARAAEPPAPAKSAPAGKPAPEALDVSGTAQDAVKRRAVALEALRRRSEGQA